MVPSDVKLPSQATILAESEHYWSDKSIWLCVQMLQYAVKIPAKKQNETKKQTTLHMSSIFL